MRISLIIGMLLILWSCSSDKNTDELQSKIKQQEEVLSGISKDLRPGQVIPLEEQDKLVNLLTEYFHSYPEDEYAPVCLDKLHMIYSSIGEYNKSSAYGDTLLSQYTAYENRPLILESMAVNYDMFIIPRDTNLVRTYYEMLLEEDDKMPKEKKEGILFKLNNLSLTMEELILKVN